MKKIVLFLSLFFTSIIVANAELCIHVSGDGTNIGDEIACGTEHFYVISNDGENIRMMAKYNLYVGNDFYRVDFDTPYTSENDIYLNKKVQEKVKDGYEIYDWIYEYDIENDKYLIQGVILYKESKYKTQNKYIFFEETKIIEEALRDEEVQEYLEDNYSYYFITISTGEIIGVEFFKNTNYLYGTVILDESVTEKADVFKKTKVQQYFSEYAFSSYILDSEDNYLGAKFYLDSSNKYKTIILDRETSTYSLLHKEQIKKELEDGWAVYNQIGENWSNTWSLGVSLYKTEGIEYKTIVDGLATSGDSYITDLEFYKNSKILELLDLGYKLENQIKIDDVCTLHGGDSEKYCHYSTYGATFSKNENYEYYNVIFNEEIAWNDLNNYLENNEEIQKKLSEGFYLGEYHRINHGNSYGDRYYGVRLDKKLKEQETEEEPEKEKIYQNEIAIGATNIERGETAPFENGVIYNEEMGGFFTESDKVYGTGFRNYEYYESEYENRAYYYLNTYKDTLINDGYEIIDIDVITVSELNNLVYKVSGKKLPLEDWYNEGIGWRDDYAIGNEYYVLGSIKDLMPVGYEWIWGTTYWTRTADQNFDNIYFIDTLGDLCSNEYCGAAIGAGIRPIVTIKADDVVYKIDTVTDGHGTIKADYIEAKEGTVVKFTVEPMEGYVLGEVKVTDANGNVVIFKDYTFTMPNANVTIEATFIKIDNPNTMTYISVIVVIGLIISGTIFYKSKKKLN